MNAVEAGEGCTKEGLFVSKCGLICFTCFPTIRGPMCVSFPLVVLPSPGDLNSGTTGPKLRRKMYLSSTSEWLSFGWDVMDIKASTTMRHFLFDIMGTLSWMFAYVDLDLDPLKGGISILCVHIWLPHMWVVTRFPSLLNAVPRRFYPNQTVSNQAISWLNMNNNM